MNKLEILQQITTNTKLMNAMQELIELQEPNSFTEHLIGELHDLRRYNGELVHLYSRLNKIEEIVNDINNLTKESVL